MATSKPASRDRTKRRLLRALGVVLAPVTAIVVMAGPAFAEQRACTTRPTHNVCLTIYPLDDGNYKVTLGIDVHMSQQDAQAIIDRPGDPFTGRVFGSDSSNEPKQFLFAVPLDRDTVIATAEFGLSAGFSTIVSPDQLNEDNSPGNRVDEVFGRVRLIERAASRDFNTPEIHNTF
ncbi:hypothetical protein HS041_27520 [Planomonospora sp. ID67723]|uniref:hypothetical protein n=1 Tax=Planomonospora sp. ID67723 TaxID=2738134 RepID=UPI0018C40A75|nr:hypothetical protein [Planomonospora sp. ID67723]MBG0831492.1 hypothetical protein [Planomonospora sp. ID67723]